MPSNNSCEELPCNCPPESCQEECTYPAPPIPCTDGCLDIVMTDCIKNSDEIEVCGDVIEANSMTLTELLTIFASALDCQNIPCDDVTKTINYLYTGITKAISYYQSLDPNYFTKSDVITQIAINDNSSVTGDTLAYLDYSSLPLLTQYVLTPLNIGSNFNLATNICGKDLVSTTNEIWTKMLTTRSCFETKMCTLDATQVEYSERYNFPYRANFQIDDVSITNTPGIDTLMDKGTLYLNDVLFDTPSSSDGGIIRKINLNTGELITLAGNISAGLTPITYNNVWGNVVEYDYNSTVILDKNELVNGEPVIYFCTFGGVVCRLVRERNSECDERANWKNYIIAGENGSVTNIPSVTGLGNVVTGTAARFAQPYGIKKWYTVNGEPSFLIADSGNSVIKLIYYIDGVGGKNSSNNWHVANMGFTLQGNSSNINVEDNPIPAFSGEKRLIILRSNKISFTDYTGADYSVANVVNIANYSTHYAVNAGAVGVTDGPGTTALVYNPHWIFRVGDILGTYYYVFGHRAAEPIGGPYLYTESRLLRKLEEDNNLTLGTEADYTFSTLIPSTGLTADGYVGSFAANANVRMTQGMFKDLLGNYYDITRGGIRLYNFGSSSIASVVSGASSLANTTVTTTVGVDPMDTQYELTLNC